MTIRFCKSGLIAAFLVASVASSPTRAQTEIVAPPSPDADALAAEVRILAANPTDMNALLSAGELALKLGDTIASARFFARAERLEPRNGRLKAGTARILVTMERPGEALMLFAEAESLGYDVDSLASERGLAFDLIGQQERAQRDYRRVLKRGPDDETLRRYALSLGISGKRDDAFVEIDALLRRSDRAAWRARAFILAMSGDVGGAERIMTSMLPVGMASGLLPFLRRLESLSPVDRAFAVHFGELTPTPTRLSDARLAPVLQPLLPEQSPFRVAAATPTRDGKANRRDRVRPDRAKQAMLVARENTAVVTLPPPPPPPTLLPARPDKVAAAPVQMVQQRAVPQPAAPQAAALAATKIVASSGPLMPALPVIRTQTIESANPAVAMNVIAPSAAAGNAVSSARPAVNTDPMKLESRKATELSPAPSPSPSPTPRPTPTPALAATSTMSASVVATVPPNSRAPATREESILSKIIAGIAVPTTELGASPQLRSNAPSDIAAGPPTEKIPEQKPVAEALSADVRSISPVVTTIATAKGEAKNLPKVAPEMLTAADKKKIEAAAKKAAEKKAADKKAAEEKAAELKLTKANPSRVWVQVAGGSSIRDLPKEWAKLQEKAAALKGRGAWSTPLRFTNRLLTGPFKSADEAQTFVNQIAKSGLTGFVFTSDSGQKIDRLPGK